jgi:hypothetical protein
MSNYGEEFFYTETIISEDVVTVDGHLLLAGGAPCVLKIWFKKGIVDVFPENGGTWFSISSSASIFGPSRNVLTLH